MRELNTIVVVMLLANTCPTTDNLCQAETLPAGQEQARQDHAVAAAIKSGLGEPALAHTDGRRVRRLPSAISPVIQPVAYLQDPSDAQPLMPEFLPQPSNLVTSELTLTELEEMALQNNPAVAEAASRVNAARGNWVQVGLPPNPLLGYSGQQLGSHGQAEQQGVFIGQDFVTGKKLRLNRQIAAWQIRRAERELETIRLRVLTDVRIRYYHVLIAQRRRDVAADLVRISGQGVEAAQALFKGAEVSEADPLRARVEADTAGILLQNSINQHVESWRQLTAVLGMPTLALGRLEGDLKANDFDSSWQDTLRQVLSDSPEMAAAIADVEAARWAVERAYAEVVPNINVKAVIQDDRGTGSNNGNLQVSIPIPFWNRNQGGIQRARAESAAATQAVDRLALDLQSRLAGAFQRYESARNQVQRYSRKDGILETSQRTLELIRIGYKADEFGVLDLLSAQRTYSQANLLYLDSIRELSVSAMEIRGLLLRDSLSK